MAENIIRVGFAGAGYIATWHAAALTARPGVRLVAVADPAMSAAEGLAARHGATAYPSLDAMLDGARLDAVHILTPPQLHRDHALSALAAGAHVLVEKPFALTAAEATEMAAAANAAGRVIAVNHNFLGLPSYLRLKRLLAEGALGRLDAAEFHWRLPLAPLRSGPFGLWMLRAPQNLFLELGPHLFALAGDLLGPLEEFDLRLSKPITIPGGVEHHQGWSIRARAGVTDVSFTLSLVEGGDDRSVSLRGVAAAARLDLGADVLVVVRPNASDIVLNPLRHQLDLAGQHLWAGAANATRQFASLNRKSPYALGFQAVSGAFYDTVRRKAPIDARFSGAAAVRVMDGIGQVLALLPAPSPDTGSASVPALTQPLALVVGGTGFIGRALTRALVSAGHPVRVLSRSRANPFADLGGAVEICPVDLKDGPGLQSAMQGVATVYHLAKAEEATWEGYLENDVRVTETLAGAALAEGVGRFVYTGTIASYDSSRPDRPIDEATPFGPMEARNLYARSKALCEERLLALHRDKGLPLVIARPGIVVGAGGPLQHWGIGRWHGAGAVRIWGNGRNKLPFVLVDDVASALVRMADVPGIAGQSFNLVGDPLMSAQDYFAAIHRITGTRIWVARGSLAMFYLGDRVKYLLKRHVLRKRGITPPSRIDWVSRGHLSPFLNAKAKTVLDWQPEADPQRFAQRAVSDLTLFGF